MNDYAYVCPYCYHRAPHKWCLVPVNWYRRRRDGRLRRGESPWHDRIRNGTVPVR